MQWFRLHHSFFSDPKVATFSPSDRYALLVLYWLASESSTRGTFSVDAEDFANLALVGDVQNARRLLDRFASKRLIVENPDGSFSVPSWDKRQPTSDNVNERVKRHRNRQQVNVDTAPGGAGETLQGAPRNVSVTNRTEQNRVEQNRTDTPPVLGVVGNVSATFHDPEAPPSGIPETRARAQGVTLANPDRPAVFEDVLPIVGNGGGTKDDARDYYDLRERDGWTITNREGHPRPVRNWRADCQLWTRDRVRQRLAGKLKEPKGSAEPAIPPKIQTRHELRTVNGRTVAVEVPITNTEGGNHGND